MLTSTKKKPYVKKVFEAAPISRIGLVQVKKPSDSVILTLEQ